MRYLTLPDIQIQSMKIKDACIAAGLAVPSNADFTKYTADQQQWISDAICRSNPDLHKGNSNAIYYFMGHVNGLDTSILDLQNAVWKEAFNTLTQSYKANPDTAVIVGVVPLCEGVSISNAIRTKLHEHATVNLLLVSPTKDDVASTEGGTQENCEQDVIGLRMWRKNGGTGTGQAPGRMFFLGMLSIPRLDSIGLVLGEKYREVISFF